MGYCGVGSWFHTWMKNVYLVVSALVSAGNNGFLYFARLEHIARAGLRENVRPAGGGGLEHNSAYGNHSNAGALEEEVRC